MRSFSHERTWRPARYPHAPAPDLPRRRSGDGGRVRDLPRHADQVPGADPAVPERCSRGGGLRRQPHQRPPGRWLGHRLAGPARPGDALHDWERPKLDRYRSHLFLTAYGARLDHETGELADRWDASPDLAGHGVGYLLHGLLDYIVDGHFEAVQSLDDTVEDVEDDLFSGTPQGLLISSFVLYVIFRRRDWL